MAKRVGGNRGLWVGLIIASVVAVAMGVLFAAAWADRGKYFKLLDKQTTDIEQAQSKLITAYDKLKNRGIEKQSIAAGIDELVKQNEDYERLVGRLGLEIDGQAKANDIKGEAVKLYVSGRNNAAAQARKTATAALRVIPGAGVPNTEAIDAESSSLKSCIEELHTHVKALSDDYQNKARRIVDLEANNQSLNQTIADIKTAAQQKYDGLTQEKQQSEANLLVKVKEIQDQADGFEQQREATREAMNKAAAGHKAQNQKLANRILELEKQISEIVAQIERRTAAVFSPDGKVVSIAPGSRTGYINLAKGDSVFNNLTFSVFDQTELGKEKPQPKGFLRITNVMAETSEVYISSYRKDNPVVEGDAIANVAYDRDRLFHFAIVGRFDIDGDGSDDRGIIENMIRQFGGAIDPKISARTDYLIVGGDPVSGTKTGTPMSAPGEAQSAVRQALYGESTDVARRLWIPVLNRNRFLALVGIRPAGMN